jgi:acyl dehydratase
VDFTQCIGHELNPGPWFLVSQERITAFAECTEDRQFIHVDPIRAAHSPFEGKIAHGFLTLSLLAPMCSEGFSALKRGGIGLNYGLEKVRFLMPVRARIRIRAHMKILEVREKKPGSAVVRFGVLVEIEHESKPVLIAEWLVMWLPAESAGRPPVPR